MLKREKNYLKHIFSMAVNNPLRFWLCALGFFIAMLIFSFGNILISSYYDSKFESLKEMDDTSVFVMTEHESEELTKYIRNLDQENYIYFKVGKDKESLMIQEKDDDESKVRFVLSAKVLGVSKNLNGILPVRYGDYEYAQSKPRLIKGRYIDIQDVSKQNNVVVIDELTERILFGKEDAIGKEIKLNANFSGSVSSSNDTSMEETEKAVSLKVVGVVENNYYSRNQEMLYEEYLNEGKNNIFVETLLYCPVSIEYIQKECSDENYYIWSYKGNEEYVEALNRVNSLMAYFKGKSTEIDVCDKETAMLELEEEMKTLKILVYAVIIVLVVIAGVSTMNIMFFSVKERINEIGIKKALGATKLDIVVQFVLEGQIIGILASSFAVFTSIMATKVLEYYINSEMYIYFRMNIGLREVCLPMCLAVFFSFLFSLLPSIYGANINVTKALRFE